MFDERPDVRGLLIFDGDCDFCTLSAQRVSRLLPASPATIAYQYTDLKAYGLTIDDAQKSMWLVTPSFRYGGCQAISALLRYQPAAGLRFLGWMLDAPPWSWAAALGYAFVARYSHRFPGGTPACRLKQ
jgi:predicted DCC family thiol-disulfide oxidoreductase YuxK